MTPNLVISKSIDINSSPQQVWDVLVNPKKIEQYFTGAQTLTDWQVGSEIVFVHLYEGKEFKNKGVILNYDPHKFLAYTYWTAFSNTEDKPENYTKITYTLTQVDSRTILSFTQTNFKNLEWYNGLKIGWDVVLRKIKELAEG